MRSNICPLVIETQNRYFESPADIECVGSIEELDRTWQDTLRAKCLRRFLKIHWRGASFEYNPTCGYNWTYFHAAQDVGRLLGRQIVEYTGYQIPYVIQQDAPFTPARSEAWRVAFENTMPLLSGGKAAHYVLRDVAHYVATHNPRRPCFCGKRRGRWEDERVTHTYLMSDPPFLKIGRTNDMKRRWPTQWVTDNPRPVTLVGLIHGDVEAYLHRRCDAYHHRGEWYEDCYAVRRTFARVKRRYERHYQHGASAWLPVDLHY